MSECASITDPCLCFAASSGKQCSYCSASSACLPREDVLAECADEAPEDRREKAKECGSKKIDLVASQGQEITWPFEGDESNPLTIDLGTTFGVEKVKVLVLQGNVTLSVTPDSTMRDTASLENPCPKKPHGPSCTWDLEVPFMNVLTVKSTGPFKLGNVTAMLDSFTPLDFVIAPVGGWDECNTTCGTGMHSRVLECTPPDFGGLPCTQANGEPFVGNQTVWRECTAFAGCETNWSVMLIVGWWQVVLVAVFFSRKIFNAVVTCRRNAADRAHARRRRFSSDFGEELGLDERLGEDMEDSGGDSAGSVDLKLT